jgi:hypothetical protein
MKKHNRLLIALGFFLVCIVTISNTPHFYLPSTLSILVNAPKLDFYRVLYDVERAHNREHAVLSHVEKCDGFTLINFKLPAKKIKSIRIDTGNYTGTIKIKHIYLSSFAKVFCWSPSDIARDFRARNDIAEFYAKDDLLYIESTGEHPRFEYVSDFSAYSNLVCRIDKSYLYFLSLILSIALFFTLDLFFMAANFMKSFLQIKKVSSVIIFLVAFFVALAVYAKIKLPFSNPWQVTGPLTILQYNPANDIIRFLLFVFLPAIVISLAGFSHSLKRAFSVLLGKIQKVILNDQSPKIVLYLLVATTVFFISGSAYKYHGHPNPVPLDTFHEGESIGPAIDYLNGKVPYKDTIFIHGAFQDPIRSVLAFKLFGKSIASVRTLFSIMQIITFIAFCVCLYFLFACDIYYTSISFFILIIFVYLQPWEVAFSLPSRDILLFAFIVLAVFINKHLMRKEQKKPHSSVIGHVLLFLLPFTSTIAFSYSIDRGFYLFATSLATLFFSYVFLLRKEDVKYLYTIIGGYILGTIVLGFAIKWAFYDFAKFTFLVMPRYKELYDGIIYPFNNFPYLFPVFLISIIFCWLIRRFICFNKDNKTCFMDRAHLFYCEYFLEIVLFTLSVFYFRSALGRSDIFHVYYASGPIFILAIYIMMNHYMVPLFNKIQKENSVKFVLSITLCIVFAAFYLPKMDFDKLYKFPLGISDSELIPKDYRKTITFLHNNLADDEDFFTMTSEAMWYYFIDKPCPTRFSIVWFAMPSFYQTEIVDSLKKRNVKFILYKNNHLGNIIDFIHTERRLPIVIDYIKNNYVFYKNIDGNKLWVKNK